MKLILFFVAVFSTATNGARIGTIDRKTFVANEPFDYTKHTNGETYLEIRNMNGSIGEKTFLNFQNVETMFLFYGRLKEVDFTGFTVMPNLKKLVLNDVKIEGSSLKITNDNLKNMPNLKTLHIFLDEVYVKHIESDVFANTNLEELIIEHIKVHKLIGMDKLKSLGIWFGNTENMDGNIFNEVPNLEDLDLKGNKLPLKQGFFKSLKKLQNLELPNINNGGLKELMWEYLEGLENLKRFDLKVNDVKTITKPSDEMVPLKNMEEIDLSINEIETVDWQFLKVFPNLKILNLASNDITKVKNVTIIPDGHNLRELQLEGNSIKRFSWDFLKNFPHLEILQLHENQLIDIDSQKIISFLPKLKKITLFGQKTLGCDYLKDVSEDIKQANSAIEVEITKSKSGKFQTSDCS